MANLTTTRKASTVSLFKHCFDQMQKLNIKALDPNEAKAQAALLKQANNLLMYELDRAKTLSKGIEIREIEELD